jgi:hypothetical protein
MQTSRGLNVSIGHLSHRDHECSLIRVPLNLVCRVLIRLSGLAKIATPCG